MVGDALSLAVQNTATIIAAIVIAFTETWELSLLILALMPFIGIQVCLQVKFMKVFRAEIKTVGLIAENGCGESTGISLLERFYDPDSGHIFLDGVELNKVQVTWLRHQMGLVSQEPVLFNDIIRSNICYGCGEDGNTTGTVSDHQIVSAAKASNAHDFISSLPQGYNTRVGQSGILLSGGQKQRIVIARAILRDPKILLLDEATSALDAKSEHIVQHALDRVMMNRTTIVISHELSPIKNADIIAVVKNGVVAEQGHHDELITKVDGIYASLVKLHTSS